MSGRLATWSRRQLPASARFDPASLGDPRALDTEWTPLEIGATPWRTHRFEALGDRRARFRVTIGGALFGWVFVVLGVAMLASPGVRVWFLGEEPSDEMVVAAIMGLLALAAGSWNLYELPRSINFELNRGLFWRGRPPEPGAGAADASRSAWLVDVRAVQLLRCGGRGTPTELNLVLAEGRRVHVVKHGSRQAMREDAAALGRFLGVPVWDGTVVPPPTV